MWTSNKNRSLNEETDDKIRKYRTDYNNNNDISFMTTIASTSGSLHSDFVFSSLFKSCVGNILTKTVVLRITLYLDGVSITSKSHTHPSHSQSSRL